jgi:predicted transglutaminase-like cysteine proteinase
MWANANIYIIFLLYTVVIAVRLAERRIEKARLRKPGNNQYASLHENSWGSVHKNVPLRFFGIGCKQDFAVYFDRASSVQVKKLDDVLDWLLSCKYVTDSMSQGVPDHWQHPVDFESFRAGDCEDHALWAWRKLVELGYKAEFMAGKRIREGVPHSHAWVIWHHKESFFLLETTAKQKDRVIKTQEEALTEYVPFVAVDENKKRKVYMGFPNWILLPGSHRKAAA